MSAAPLPLPTPKRDDDFDAFVDEQWATAREDGFAFYEVAGARMRPSDVLFALEPDIYETAYLEWLDDPTRGESDAPTTAPPVRPSLVLVPALVAGVEPVALDRKTVSDTVFHQFPTPIAASLWRFERSFQNHNQRLGFMRDVWESLIFVLYGLVMGEFHAANLPVPPGRWMNAPRLWSDKLGIRLEILSQLLEKLPPEEAARLGTLRRLSPALLETLKDLNTRRNDFSHSAQRTESQAQNAIVRNQDTLGEALEGALWLRDVRIVRYLGNDGTMFRHKAEFFVGNPNINANDPFEITPAQLGQVAPFLRADKILVMLDDAFWNAAPFLHFRETDNDPCARLCSLKQNGDQPGKPLAFGLVAEPDVYPIERALFSDEFAAWDAKLSGN